jgi:hypothetical protein
MLVQFRTEIRPGLDISLASKLIYTLVETMTHDAVLNHPTLLVEKGFIEELTRMVIAYLQH